MADPWGEGAYASSGGFRIHYEATGQGPPLVLLNGWSASGLLWPVDWVRRLGGWFTVVRLSFRGTGYSDPCDQPFTMADMAGDALSVLDAAGIDRAAVLGLSMGGMVAQHLALDHPDRVRGLVLMSTAPPWPDMVVNPQNPIVGILTHRRAAGAAPQSGRELLDAIWSALAGPGFADRHPDRIRELVGQAGLRPTRPAMIGLQFQAIQGHKAPERLAALRVPTLVIHGDADQLLPVPNGRRLAELVPGARYVELPEVGHLVPWEAPDESLGAIRETLLGG